MRKSRLKTIQAMPTLHQGQYDDLKFENKTTRIWLSRMTVDDGMEYNNQVTEEALQLQKTKGNRVVVNKPMSWQTVRQYEAK